MNFCSKCNSPFLTKPAQISHEKFCGKKRGRRYKKKIPVELTKGRALELTPMTNAVRLTRRFLMREQFECAICGWNESKCDVHHIVSGEESFENLIIVCPNCHRVIHKNKKYSLEFLKERNITKLFLKRPDLYDFYMKRFSQEQKRRTELTLPESISKNNLVKIELVKEAYHNSTIDFSKFGWVNNVSKLIGIRTQKINKWMRRYMFKFYDEHCFKRS